MVVVCAGKDDWRPDGSREGGLVESWAEAAPEAVIVSWGTTHSASRSFDLSSPSFSFFFFFFSVFFSRLLSCYLPIGIKCEACHISSGFSAEVFRRAEDTMRVRNIHPTFTEYNAVPLLTMYGAEEVLPLKRGNALYGSLMQTLPQIQALGRASCPKSIR